jgi:hypothetical protein
MRSIFLKLSRFMKGSKFSKLKNQDLSTSAKQSARLIQSFKAPNFVSCLAKCISNSVACSVAVFNAQRQCCLYAGIIPSSSLLVSSQQSTLYVNTEYKDGLSAYLAYYWPFDSNYNEIKVGATTTKSSTGVSLVTDRFGKATSALSLSNGYLQVNNGIYISGDFTITAWLKINSNVSMFHQ